MALAGSRLGIIAVGAVMLMLIVQMAEASQLPFVQQQLNFLRQSSAAIDYLDFIMKNFNSDNFGAIWDQCDDAVKSVMSKDKFVAEYKNLKAAVGQILGNVTIGVLASDPSCTLAYMSFQKNLDIGVQRYCVDEQGLLKQISTSFPSQVSTYSYIKSANQSSLCMKIEKNGQVFVDLNSDGLLPLMSTYKATVAIQFSLLVTARAIDPDQMISIDDQLNLYFAPDLDSSHAQWLTEMQQAGKIVDGKVRLMEIVYGMIKYSSNCNTEFLQDLVGIQNIEQTLKKMGIKITQQYYLVSSMLAMANVRNLTYDDWLNYLRNLSHSQLVFKAQQLHYDLKHDPSGKIRKDDLWFLDPKVLDIYSDVSMMSSCYDYVKMMQIINSETYFDSKTQKMIEDIMGYVTSNTDFGKAHYKYSGLKGGSSNYPNMTKTVLALTGFEKDLADNKVNYFFDFSHMTHEQWTIRYYDIDGFIISSQFDDAFLKEFSQRIKAISVQ